MLPNLQFTDFHKFLVSIGGLLVGLSVTVQVFLLRPLSALTVTRDELDNLTPTATMALRTQQHQAALLLAISPWVSLGLAITGFVLTFWGAALWKKRQKALNDREAAELKKVEAESDKLHHEKLAIIKQHKIDEEENYDTVISEASGEQPSSAMPYRGKPVDSQRIPLGNETPQPTDPSPAQTLIRLASDAPTGPAAGMLRYLAAREAVLAAIRELYTGQLDVTPEVRIFRQRLDMVIMSRNDGLPNLVVEFTVLDHRSQKSVRDKVYRTVEWLESAPYIAQRKFEAEFRPLVVYLLRNERTESFKESFHSILSKISALPTLAPASGSIRIDSLPGSIVALEEEHIASFELSRELITAPSLTVSTWPPS
ncbi:hypothetical protein [Actinoplanes sp. NPDC051851]|uniref:hypothetical protein n=1 Tax=Actinoplanes sp. NPDC051851 TaxID=3154753 RepID=UPI003428EA5B